MKPALYLIPVTIGNTDPSETLPRAVLEIIHQIDEFVVENVRTARRFLLKAGYKKNIAQVKFYSIGKHDDPADLAAQLNLKQRETPIGLLSENGSPCIADPGAFLVRICHENNFPVIPLPGPSSILLALMASGFNGQNFVFHGYLPVDQKLLKARLRELSRLVQLTGQTHIFIETPFRNDRLISAILQTCHESVWLCVAANLTETNERVISMSIGEWKKFNHSFHKQPAVFLLGK